MPNYCNFEIRIKGQKENVQTMLNWMNAEYHYNGWKREVYLQKGEEKIPQKHHIGYRVFGCGYNEKFLNSCEAKSDVVIEGFGDCAWSCYSCMFEGPHTYLSDFSLLQGVRINIKDCIKQFKLIKLCRALSKTVYKLNPYKYIQSKIVRKAISLPDACKKLRVEVELWSTEPGCCFAEHYYINNKGEIIAEESTEFETIYVDEYDTYEDYIKHIKEEYPNDKQALSVTKEEFDNSDGFIDKCDWLVNGEFEYQYISL